jgi:hypothetical protein
MNAFFQIVEYANNRDFTSLIVVHTNRREPGTNQPFFTGNCSTSSFYFVLTLFCYTSQMP